MAQGCGPSYFDGYFGLMTDDAVFIGADAMENWLLAEFKECAKPHFDKGRAWSFTAVERNGYAEATGQFAWFDELFGHLNGFVGAPDYLKWLTDLGILPTMYCPLPYPTNMWGN